ncbi:MAG: S1 family peptidase [Verrucomicrobiales bacterium]
MNNSTGEDKVRSASRVFVAFGVVLVCVFLAALIYRSFLRDQREDRIVEHVGSAAFQEANTIAKAASLKALGVTRLQEETVGEFMAARMALLVGPEMPEPVYGERFLQKAGYEKHIRNTPGVLTAVSPDGYFLTAAHCLVNEYGTQNDPLWVVGLTTANRYLAQGDVVWLSEERDLALIHARIKQAKWFTVSDASPEIGSTVIAGGCVNGLGAGNLLSRTKDSLGTPLRIRLNHNVPLIEGDSGGPLVDMKGHLVGINFSIRANLDIFEKPIQKSAHANVVTRDWLQRLIQDHRNQMNSEEQQPAEQGGAGQPATRSESR